MKLPRVRFTTRLTMIAVAIMRLRCHSHRKDSGSMQRLIRPPSLSWYRTFASLPA